jgi:mono/diheme cytochrome c family protein
MKRMLIGTIAAAALFVAAGTASAQDKVEKGKQVYADQKCAMCHSIEGKGNAKGPLDGVGSKLTADEIRQWITHPADMAAKAKADRKPAMPAKYASLPAADLDNLVAYLSSLKKK